MRRSRLERETQVLFNDEEDEAWVGTTSPTQARRLIKRLGQPTRMLDKDSWSWTVPKHFVTLPRKKTKRVKNGNNN